MSSSVADRDTYVLMKRFAMPRGNDTVDAIAVTSSHGLILISFYTIMIKAIITQFWTGIVLFGVGLFLRRHPPNESDSPAATTTIGLWNVKHSPQQVVYFMTGRAVSVKSWRDTWYPFTWFALAAVALAASLAVPIVKTQDLKIGSVAPVNPKTVFIPFFTEDNTSNQITAQQYSLTVPAAQRAVGAAGTVPANTVFTSNVTTPSVNGSVVQFSYNYGLSGSDFGLQKTPDLWFNVSGSCFTDYTWYLGEDANGNDIYAMYNDDSNLRAAYLSSDNGPPYARGYSGTGVSDFNTTFSFLVSSVGRQSFSISTDPWYQTPNEPASNGAYLVAHGRPALSCWEQAVWSFRGNTSDLISLQNNTGGRISGAIAIALGEYLFTPMLLTTAVQLGQSNLESSTTFFISEINAEQSSLVSDMVRLVNTSYIATRNILSDSTTIQQNRGGVINAYNNSDGSLPAGADEFVISSSDIYTLSVRVLIIVPAVFVGVIVLLLVLAFLPDPWRSSKELNAVRMHELKRQHTKTLKKKAKEGDK